MERKKKIEVYYGLIDIIVDKILTISYYRKYRHLREDLISEGALGLIDAVDTFDPTRNVKEVSYISLKVRGYVLNFIKKYVREETPLIDIEDELYNIAREDQEHTEDFELIDRHEPKDKINKEIYHRCLMGDTTCQSLADELGVSRNSIKLRKKKLIKKLYKDISEELKECSQ